MDEMHMNDDLKFRLGLEGVAVFSIIPVNRNIFQHCVCYFFSLETETKCRDHECMRRTERDSGDQSPKIKDYHYQILTYNGARCMGLSAIAREFLCWLFSPTRHYWQSNL